MKKNALALVLALTAAAAFGQMYRTEGESKNGPVSLSLHVVEYTDYHYLLLVDNVSIFVDEDTILHLAAVLEKFAAWEAIAAENRATLTKTIDSITFTSFHYSHTFFREPVIFYFVFTGGPLTPEGESETRYTLYIDTTLDRITPFRLSSAAARELLEALAPEKRAEARETWERQKALENLFN